MAGSGSVVKFAPNGTMSPFALGLFLPSGLAVDSSNNVYVADLGSGSVFRFTSGGTKTTFASGLSSPRSLAFDRNGILYVGEFGTHDIVKFPGGVKTPFSHDDTFIGGLAFEPPTAYDFNQDGKPDYVLYNAVTHQTAVWYLNNNLFSSAALYGPTLPAGWNVVGVADFNGDGQPDYLLFNSSTRQTAIWYLNNNVFSSGPYGPTLPAGWSVVGVADFNGDGHPDYLLFNQARDRRRYGILTTTFSARRPVWANSSCWLERGRCSRLRWRRPSRLPPV